MQERTPSLWKPILAAMVLSSFIGCSPPDRPDIEPPTAITESKALEISRKAAENHGYDLARYRLDTFGDQTGGGDKAWLFVYLCSPGPPSPGCSFMVVVDRRTGKADIHPGE